METQSEKDFQHLQKKPDILPIFRSLQVHFYQQTDEIVLFFIFYRESFLYKSYTFIAVTL